MACYGCSALEEVVIPEGTTKIGGQAFYECRALTDVYCRAGVPPLLGIQVFEGTSIKNLYVPEGSADAYREAEGWSLFEHIEEREFRFLHILSVLTTRLFIRRTRCEKDLTEA